MFKMEEINKWWDNLNHTQKEEYLKKMNPFNYGKPIYPSMMNKNQKQELYHQVHNMYNKKLLY